MLSPWRTGREAATLPGRFSCRTTLTALNAPPFFYDRQVIFSPAFLPGRGWQTPQQLLKDRKRHGKRLRVPFTQSNFSCLRRFTIYFSLGLYIFKAVSETRECPPVPIFRRSSRKENRSPDRLPQKGCRIRTQTYKPDNVCNASIPSVTGRVLPPLRCNRKSFRLHAKEGLSAPLSRFFPRCQSNGFRLFRHAEAPGAQWAPMESNAMYGETDGYMSYKLI